MVSLETTLHLATQEICVYLVVVESVCEQKPEIERGVFGMLYQAEVLPCDLKKTIPNWN